MSKSLQEQLLGAKLVDNKKAKQVSKEKRKNKNVQRRIKEPTLTEAQEAARKAKQEKVERDNALNQERNNAAKQKALAAQITQMIKHYQVSRQGGKVEYNFTDGKLIKKMLVDQKLSNELSRGRLCIAKLNDQYEIIPRPVADKICERDASVIIVQNEKPTTETVVDEDSDEAYYAQFEIPDDLDW